MTGVVANIFMALQWILGFEDQRGFENPHTACPGDAGICWEEEGRSSLFWEPEAEKGTTTLPISSVFGLGLGAFPPGAVGQF